MSIATRSNPTVSDTSIMGHAFRECTKVMKFFNSRCLETAETIKIDTRGISDRTRRST
jgi:hypothetical protein